MISIRLVFTAGRYHATPWGRHVNEGASEWPPSPYRLLRALFDTWQRKCPELDKDIVRGLLQVLAASPPKFILPRAVATHTRSYLSANALDPTDKNLVFDSFLVFDRQHECFITWENLDLAADLRSTLRQLLENLNYLGRSESWVHAEIQDNVPKEGNVCDVVDKAGHSGELVSVACAVPTAEYNAKVPWMDALTFSTTQLLKEHTSSPPLLKQVRYLRADDSISTDPPSLKAAIPRQIGAVLLSLDSTVLPLVTATVEVAEQIRTRLMGAHKARMGNDPTKVSSVFSGKSADGSKRLDHGHVYILPLESKSHEPNKQGRIDRVLILSLLDCFKQDELRAIGGVTELWQAGNRPKVRCVITWQGPSTESTQRVWTTEVESATPFVPPRLWRKGRDFRQFIQNEVERECRNHRINASLQPVEPINKIGSGRFDVVEYRRNRKEDPVRRGYSFRLIFSEPVLAPFAIGYGAHFGLGQFLPTPI
ncbi:MAG TPA: type I-U CRISPR-associated protein Csb2 [Terriglobia bacterium]